MWLQDDENGEEASQVFEFIKIPSYGALISDDSSKPVYFVKVEAKANCEEIIPDTYGHTLNSGEKYFRGKYFQKLPQMRYLRHLLDLMTSWRWITMSIFF